MDRIMGNGTTVYGKYTIITAKKQLYIANVTICGNDGPVASSAIEFGECADIYNFKVL